MATATPRSRHAARLRADRRRAQARARRFAVVAIIVVLAVVTLALTAFDNESAPAVSRPAPLPVTSAPPDPHILATVGNLRVQSPVAEGGVTAIGFHGSEDGALVVKPVGPQVNEGLVARLWRRITGASRSGLAWYQLSGGPLRTLDVGAVAGTDVYSPVDGTVVGITPYVLAGKHMGARIDIQPSGNPSLVVSLTHLRPDPNLTVGSTLEATTSKIGTILDFARVERQALARVTTDAGNHVAIEVHAATLSLP
jgi:hypothetical protein